ncbi:hypothetical protein PCE1_003328 [Barthelona sp. PCE]
MSVKICLDRANRTFYPHDIISGDVLINSTTNRKHNGVLLTIFGHIQLTNTDQVNVNNQLYPGSSPGTVFNKEITLCPPDRLTEGETKYRFEVPLEDSLMPFIDSYEGYFIEVKYSLSVTVQGSLFVRDLVDKIDFIIRTAPPASTEIIKTPHKFSITRENCEVNDLFDSLNIVGLLDSTIWSLNENLSGWIQITECDIPVEGIMIQLSRIERVGNDDRESSEIENIEVATGNIEHNLKVPLYLPFPQRFTCPTIDTPEFEISYKINIVVTFPNSYFVTKAIAITLV